MRGLRQEFGRKPGLLGVEAEKQEVQTVAAKRVYIPKSETEKRPLGISAQNLPPTDLGTRRQAKPRGKMFGRLPAAHIRADLGKNVDGRIGVDRGHS